MQTRLPSTRTLALTAIGLLSGITVSCRDPESFGVSGFSIGKDGSTSSYSAGTIPDLISASKERKAGPLPESEWNKRGLWQRVADDPAVYVVDGYPPGAPRTAEVGDWFVDGRDGKRLFVPKETVGEYPPGVMRGEATKVTNWKMSYKKAWSDPSEKPTRY